MTKHHTLCISLDACVKNLKADRQHFAMAFDLWEMERI